MSRRHLMRDPGHQVALGAVLFIAAAYCIWDAYEGRGRRRPFPAAVLLP
jgi:hypothetical protein